VVFFSLAGIAEEGEERWGKRGGGC